MKILKSQITKNENKNENKIKSRTCLIQLM